MPLLRQQDALQAPAGLYKDQGPLREFFKMKCRASIFVEGDADKLEKCFAPEETRFERSSFTVEKAGNGLNFDIRSEDAVAFRASTNTITQLLAVFEGAGKKGKK